MVSQKYPLGYAVPLVETPYEHLFSDFKRRIVRFRRQIGPNNKTISRQVTELLRVYGDDLSVENRELVREFLDRTQASSMWQRLKYAFGTPVFRQRPIDSLIMRVMMVLARI